MTERFSSSGPTASGCGRGASLTVIVLQSAGPILKPSRDKAKAAA